MCLMGYTTNEPRPHFSVPCGVNGVSNDGWSSLLSVVAKDGEDAPLPRVDGHLQVRIWIEKHALLQADSSQICNYSTVTSKQLQHLLWGQKPNYEHKNSDASLFSHAQYTKSRSWGVWTQNAVIILLHRQCLNASSYLSAWSWSVSVDVQAPPARPNPPPEQEQRHHTTGQKHNCVKYVQGKSNKL